MTYQQNVGHNRPSQIQEKLPKKDHNETPNGGVASQVQSGKHKRTGENQTYAANVRVDSFVFVSQLLGQHGTYRNPYQTWHHGNNPETQWYPVENDSINV